MRGCCGDAWHALLSRLRGQHFVGRSWLFWLLEIPEGWPGMSGCCWAVEGLGRPVLAV